MGLAVEAQYVMDILTSEDNKCSLDELFDMTFRDLDEYKAILAVSAEMKAASQLDNRPEE